MVVTSIKILNPKIKMKKIFGNPNYFEKRLYPDLTREVEEIFQDISYCSSSSVTPETNISSNSTATETLPKQNLVNIDDSDDDDELLLSISEEDLNKTIEEEKKIKQKNELVNFLKQDLSELNFQKLAIMKELKPLENQHQFLLGKRNEIEKNTCAARKEISKYNIELEKVQKLIDEAEKKVETLL